MCFDVGEPSGRGKPGPASARRGLPSGWYFIGSRVSFGARVNNRCAPGLTHCSLGVFVPISGVNIPFSRQYGLN
jgi:hypothetical protein